MNRDSGMFKKIIDISDSVLGDFGGGSPINKSYLLAYISILFKLKNYTEIGVYKGKCLFPVAYAIACNGGESFGIDPYRTEEAYEDDLDEEKKKIVRSFIDNLDFDKLYTDVLMTREALGLTKQVTIMREPSESAYKKFVKNNIYIDLLHIDGNHDEMNVQSDYENYFHRISENGFIIFDDIDWVSVKKIYLNAMEQMIPIFETDTFGILMKGERTVSNLNKARMLNRKLDALYSKLQDNYPTGSRIDEVKNCIVNVGIITYNHEKYIEECLESVYSQKGDFLIRAIVIEDFSTDETNNIIREFIKAHPQNEHFQWVFTSNESNIGVFANAKNVILKAKELGCDYFTFCDGDDYWTDSSRIAKHIRLMEDNPEMSMTFNLINLFWEEKGFFEVPKEQANLEGSRFNTEDIITNYFIGNASCCFYDGRILSKVDPSIFDMDTGDWFFNIFYSLYGDIGFIKKPLSVYRKHDKGTWTGREAFIKTQTMLNAIDEYNRFLNFEFDKAFTECRSQCLCNIDGRFTEMVDLMIIDDFFPHPLSGFRYQEFMSYLDLIKSVKILSTVESYGEFSTETIEETIVKFKRKHPEYGNKVARYNTAPTGVRLLYFLFLANAYNHLSLAEANQIPFALTLYPGGQFAIDDPDSDMKLKKVLNSPCFTKVIVTQQITYDYLVMKKFCSLDKIEFIFGGVTSLSTLENPYNEKKNYGYEKRILDITFIAQKYTMYGEDKGYDVFIKIAKKLCENHDDIRFHVVGGFNESVIDIREISDSIRFYGVMSPDNFDEFFIDKDIIISPNINGTLWRGAFDGFPTGSCVEAALRKTALFCTDPLESNQSRYTDGTDIVLISRNVNEIIQKIMFYYDNPSELRTLGENSCKTTRELFGFEQQIGARVRILKEIIDSGFKFDTGFLNVSNNNSKLRNIHTMIKKITPKWLKRIYHAFRKRCPLWFKHMIVNTARKIAK